MSPAGNRVPTGGEPRVGYVLKKYPRLSETFILSEILGLEALGVPLCVFSLRSPDDGRFHGDLARVRARVRYLPPFKSRHVFEAFNILEGLGAESSSALPAALRFLKRLPEDRRTGLLLQALQLCEQARALSVTHLHAHFMTVAAHTAYLAHLFTGLPFTVTAHAKDIYRDTVDREVFREVAAAAAAVVTVCDANRRFIDERLLEDGPGRVVRIYNGIPVHEMPFGQQERDPDLVLGVGRLVEKKGFHVLLEACHRARRLGRPFRCVLLGDGEARDRLETLRVRLDLRDLVTLAGPACREEVLSWMCRASVLAAPCITAGDGNRDALPTVVLEAMASGLPVVATPLGGIPEMVEAGASGLLVPEGDASGLAGALVELLDNQGLRRRCAAAGRSRLEARFDRRHTAAELAGLFTGAPSPEPVAGGSAP